MRTIGGRTAAIVAAALLGLTAACTDDSPPPPTPTTSSSTPTSPTPTTSPTPQPESAEAFIRRWVEADIRMQNTGDAANFLALSKSCGPCERFADLVTGFYDAGGYVKTAGWRVRGVEVLSATGNRRLLLVHVLGRPTEYKESSTGVVKRLPGEKTQYQFTLQAAGTSWVVRDFVEVAS